MKFRGGVSKPLRIPVAIGLASLVPVIILVIGLSLPEHCGWPELGNYLKALILQYMDEFFGDLLLLLSPVKDR